MPPARSARSTLVSGRDLGAWARLSFEPSPRAAVLSVVTGAESGSRSPHTLDPLYQHLIVTAERKFWSCVESGEPPRLFGVEPPTPRIEASLPGRGPPTSSMRKPRPELKSLMPEDTKEATGSVSHRR